MAASATASPYHGVGKYTHYSMNHAVLRNLQEILG